MPTPPLQPDVLLIGGGIAGLWTLARLRAGGYSALLVESDSLGSTQTIGAQGIIHGGMKYALTGEASQAARAIAAMPPIWQQCLEGRGEVDLSSARVLSPCTYLWTAPGVLARIAGFAASRVLRTEVEKLEHHQRPPGLLAAPRAVDVYRVGEPVLDVAGVLDALRAAGAPFIIRGRVSSPEAARPESGRRAVQVFGEQGAVSIAPRRIVLLAGPGNAVLWQQLVGADEPVAAQTRPLHMVMVRDAPADLFGHCLGASSLPRLTVTTALDSAGRRIWYVGGSIAESGVDRSPSDQVEAARAELAHCVPWHNLDRCQWATCRWDRSEPRTADGSRPDEPWLRSHADVTVGWPTKMAFAPLLAERMIQSVQAAGVQPTGNPGIATPPAGLTPAKTALAPWNQEGVPWT